MNDDAVWSRAVVVALASRLGRPLSPSAVESLAAQIHRAELDARPVAVSPDAFAAHLFQWIEPRLDGDHPGELPDWHVGDHYLACACLAGSSAAIQRMQREHFAAVPRILHSYPGIIADEVLELLPERLFLPAGDRPAKLAQYSGRSRLRTWFKAVVLHLAQDVQRRRHAAGPIEDHEGLLQAIGLDVDRQHWRSVAASDFRAALGAAMANLKPEERLLLQGMYIEGLTLKELGAPGRVDPSTTFYRLKRIYAALRSDVEAYFKERLQLSPSECEDLVRSMLSNVDLRISRLLGGPA